MNWWMIAGGIVIAWIGGTLINDGDRGLVKWLGLVLVLFCGMLMTFGARIPEKQGYFQPDKDKCSQYVWVNDELTCVPYGEEG